MNANTREVLCAVLSHDAEALQFSRMSPRLRYAAIAYRNATTADAERALKEDATPDLAALNAAVAEAVENLCKRWDELDHVEGDNYQHGPLTDKVRTVNRARRAAMQPKPRYVVEPNSTVPVRVVVYDTHKSRPLSPPEVAALLNASVKP
jgi:hypothetical protein